MKIVKLVRQQGRETEGGGLPGKLEYERKCEYMRLTKKCVTRKEAKKGGGGEKQRSKSNERNLKLRDERENQKKKIKIVTAKRRKKEELEMIHGDR